MMSRLNKLVLPLTALLIAGGLVFFFVRHKPTAKRQSKKRSVPLVEVIEVTRDSNPRRIFASGVVVPARRSAVASEVNGRIVFVSPNLERGARVKKGEVLARIDARDFRATTASAKAQVRQAELALKLEEGQAAIAKKEWATMSDGDSDSSLVLRQPQLASARAQLDAASATLMRAQTDLSRTVIRAPFDAIVSVDSAEVGQMEGPGTVLTTLVGTDEVWVEINVPVEQAQTLPSDETIKAQIRYQSGKSTLTYAADVLRILGELDIATRTAVVILRVKKPYDGHHDFPLLPGAFVQAEIVGTPINAFSIPRRALQNEEHVFVVDRKNLLRKRDIRVVWRGAENVWIEGLNDGERVLTTNLSFLSDGREVRLAPSKTDAKNSEQAGRK